MKPKDFIPENFVLTDGGARTDHPSDDGTEEYLFFTSNGMTNNEKIDAFNDYLAPKNIP